MTIEIAPNIIIDENVRFGKPVIKGTRIDVDTIMGLLCAGEPQEAIATEYGLTLEDVLAAIRYASGLLQGEVSKLDD